MNKTEEKIKPLADEALIDMKYMVSDSGFTSRFLYKEIQRKKLASPIKFGRTSRWPYHEYKCWKEAYMSPSKK
ncbi:MAG: hypothetical protein WBR21_15005 [Rouxiella badensis]|uniref:hypothetical protein n=1 Tax=Rouxiella badensis TaxID=1646377 RepID=UPI003C5AF756